MEVTSSSSTRLGCGRDIDDVWDHINDPPTRHEMTCPYCRSARTDLAGLARATRSLRQDDDTDPDRQPSPAVIDRILTIARSEVRRGRRIPLDRLDASQPSNLTVSEQAVISVIHRVGDGTGAVQIRRCALTLVPAPEPTSAEPPLTDDGACDADLAEPGASDVTVSLKVSIDYSAPILTMVDALRETIIDVVRQEVGINVLRVDIAVEDVTNV